MMIRTLDAILSDEFKLVFARTGKESIDIISQNGGISCVLMDIRMPDISGVEAARAIRRLNPRVPIIFHTGHPGEFLEENLMKEENAFGYLTKGESIAELVDMIREASKSYREKGCSEDKSD
jgi:two-component system cell cycle response regulator DivK